MHILLAVDHSVVSFLQTADQRDETKFTGIRAVMKHTLSKKDLPQCQPVQTADELLPFVYFNTMSNTLFV